MATKTKTTETEVNVIDFIHSFIDNDQKKQDSFQLIDLMKNGQALSQKCGGQL